MKRTPVEIAPLPMIDYSKKILFFGSCFSEHISRKMKQSGFDVMAHPFGVVFNPYSIANSLFSTEEEIKKSVFMQEDVALSWLANGTCFSYEVGALQQQLTQNSNQVIAELNEGALLCVTFGTAWVYQLKNTREIVANCHKMSADLFQKRLLTVEEIVKVWRAVINQLPASNQLIFTVSPVRHSKDGMIENAQSKAVLIKAIHQLEQEFEQVHYFPSYEIVMDELRDYAYFESDGVHPNSIAIDYLWEQFKKAYLSSTAKEIEAAYTKICKLFSHRLLYPQSKKAQDFEKMREEKWIEFKQEYPDLSTKCCPHPKRED